MTDVGSGWQEAVGITFDEANRMYVWDRSGRVWIVENDVKSSTPLIDISEEVSAWNDLGCLGFALDPKFRLNGYIYLYYVVDHHHLQYFGTPQYNPAANDYIRATIGRLTRYTARASDDFRSVDPASRRILLGETASTGIPVTYNTHSVGTLVFGTDGTLLASCGDGAALSDAGNDATSYVTQALAEGIIRPKENVGAFRSQMVDSHNGKILRLNPENGDGVPSNPFYDPANPRSARSRMYALGFRNPYRMSLKPGTGSHVESDGFPGVLYVGDVGYYSWEEVSVVTGPAQNCGWPIFEGFTTPAPSYETVNPPNPDAPNPLFGISGCTLQYFRFRDLLKEATLGTPSWPNPCNTSQQVPASIPRFLHNRPAIDWKHGSGPSRAGGFVGNDAAIYNIGAPGSPVSGPQFGGPCSIGGVLYTGNQFPPEYLNRYFFADYAEGWLKTMIFDSNNVPVSVQNFGDVIEGITGMAVHPVTGELYLALLGAGVQRIRYGGNAAPRAVAASDVQYGPGPLTVQFNGSASSDPEGQALTYRWNFGDGTPLGTQANPLHTFNAPAGVPTRYDVRLTVTDTGGASNVAALIISVNNTPPVVTVTSPADGSFYPLTGDTVFPLTASVTDTEHSLAQLSPAWQVILHHNTHVHPNPIDTNWTSTAVTSPLGCGLDTYYYRITFTVSDPAGLSVTKEVKLYPDCTTNDPPFISDIPDQTVNSGQSTAAIPFTVGDAESPAGSLTLGKTSSNQTLVPLANIVFGGSGANRTVTVTPASGQIGTATITVSVSDGVYSAADSFVLSVFPANNTAPTISAIADRTIDEDSTSGAISFTIGDNESSPDTLSLSRASSNPALVPTTNIVLAGTGPNRTVTVTPLPNQNGTTTLTLTVSDGQFASSEVFVLTVTPVNDAPTLNPLSDMTISSNAGPQTVALTGIGPGAANETNQTLRVTATSSNPGVIPDPTVNYTSPAASGSLTLVPAPGADGSATITVNLDDGQTQNSNIVRTFSVTIGGPPLLYLEAESGTLASPMVVANSATANNGQYVHSPTSDQGTASYQLNIPVAGTYVVWCRVIGSNHLSDSFFVSMDGGAESVYDAALAGWSPNWQWNQLNGRGGANPRLFTLTQGNHTLRFRGRDPQTRLDAMYVTTDLSFVPPTVPGNAPPVISDIPNQSVNMDTATAAIGFTVGDAETPAANLVVSGVSSNQALVPNANIVFGGSGANRTVTVTPATGQSGTASIAVTVSDGVATATDTFVLTVNSPGGGPPVIFIEAESGTIASPMVVANSASAFNGQFVFSPNNNQGTASYQLNAPVAGTYVVWCRVIGSNHLSDSFFVSMDGGLDPVYDAALAGWSPDWQWNQVNERGGANPRLFLLAQGSHTLLFRSRDPNTRLDALYVTTDLTFVPPANPGSTPPVISDIPNQTVNMNTATPAIGFTVSDAETPAASLIVSGSSGNQTLVPNANIVFGGSGANRTVTVTPATGQSGAATITVTVGDGTATATDTFVLTVIAPNNTQPTISAIANQTTNEDTSTAAINFTVGDAESAPGTLILSAGSSNPTLAPTASIVFGGSGANRTVTVTPAADQNGAATITVTVSDGQLTASTNFVLTVNPVNDPPTVSSIADQTIGVGGSTGPLSFTIADVDTALGGLSVSSDSSNSTLVPPGNVILAGSGANRSVSVSAAAGLTGASTISIIVTDGTASVTETFVVTVSAVLTQTFSNASPITILDAGAAAPYPSVINVSGLGGTISQLAVNLNGFGQTWPSDVDVLLVGPAGQQIVVMSDVGGGTPVTGIDFLLTDSAIGPLPAAGPLASGTYQPTDLEPGDTFPAPAPTGSLVTTLAAFNGASPNGAWSLYVVDDGTGDAGSFDGGWSLTITIGAVQQTPQVTWPNPAPITYGAALSGVQLNATADVPGTFVYSPASGAVLNAGLGQTLSVTFTPTDTFNYRVVTLTRTIDVQRAALQITAAEKTKVYGSANPPLTATYSGFVNGDGPGNLTTAVSLSTTATPASPVGSYTIAAVGATSPNYTITHVNGALLVSQAPLTITADDKVRALSEPNPPLTASYAGFVNGDTAASLDTPVSLSTTATAGSPIGTYPITAIGAADANYAITHVNGTLTVTPQNPPNVTLSTNLLRYTEGSGAVLLDPLATVSDSDSANFAGGQMVVTCTSGGADEDRCAIRNQGAGPGQIGVSGFDVSYGGVLIGVFSGGDDGITPLEVLLNANGTPAAAQALLRNVTYQNISSTPSTSQRSLQVTVSDGDGGTSIPRTIAISVTGVPEDPVITWAAPVPITYGTALGGTQLNATANVPGTFAYVPAAGTVLNAGNGQTLRVAFTPDDVVNYRSVTQAVSINVLKAALTITAANKTKTYGSANPALTANYSGFVNGDSAASLTTPVSLSTTATLASGVGNYPIIASGATAANYTITHVNGTLTVTGATLTVTADNKTRGMGQPNPPLTASYAGFLNGDTVANLTTPVSLSTPATIDSPAGSYPIVASGASAANYIITHVNGTLTVTLPGGALSFTNPATVAIPHVGAATPYPSVINVTGLGGTVTQVVVALNGFNQTWPNDVDVLLVGPTGQKVMLMSDVGGGTPVTGVNFTLSDTAAANLPAAGPLVSGTFKPTDLEPGDAFPAPAPAGPTATTLAAFNGLNPNGTWSLYAVDDGAGDLGGFAGGWSLAITTAGAASAPPTITDIGNQSTAVNTPTTAIPFTVGDPDTALTSLTVSGSSGNQTLVPNANIVFGGNGANRTVTVTPASGQSGTATITVSVSDGANSASDAFVLTVGSLVSGTQSYTNATPITLVDAAAALPFPSTIGVSGLTGTITEVVARLHGFAHAYPGDADILLVGPGGEKVMLMSDAGGGVLVTNVDLTLSPLAAASIPLDSVASGIYIPTDYDVGDSFPGPAPAGPYGTNLSVFNGLSANGTWSLYAADDGAGDQGVLTGGWSLTITTDAGGVTSMPQPTISIIRADSHGAVVLTVNAAPGVACQIESSRDLVTWDPVATVQSATGISSFTDATATSRSRLFYRVVTRP